MARHLQLNSSPSILMIGHVLYNFTQVYVDIWLKQESGKSPHKSNIFQTTVFIVYQYNCC